MGIICNHFFI